MTFPGMPLAGSYDYREVALSILIAVLASYSALGLAERVNVSRGRARLSWLVCGAVAMGLGIWSMHYTGMLAFRLPIPVQYDWRTSLLSLLTAILAALVALFVASRKRMEFARALTGSIFMAASIVGLHYIAMASMRLSAMCQYSPSLVALSVVFAFVFSLLSLLLTFSFRDQTGHKVRKIMSGMLMGGAISAMHYTAMAAATFMSADVAPDLSHALTISSLGVASIGIVTVMVLEIGILTSLVDRLQEQRALLDELFEQGPEAVVLTDTNNRIVRVNRAFARIFGYSPEETVGRRLGELIVPDEAKDEERQFAATAANGPRVDAEGIRKRKDDTLLHVGIVRVAVSVPGKQIAGYAIYRDITERKQYEEQLKMSEGQLVEAQHLARIGSWNWDLTTNSLNWSDELFRIFGRRPQEFNPTHEAFLQLVHPEDLESVNEAIQHSVNTLDQLDYYVRITRPDGEVRILHSRGTVDVDAYGTPIRMYGAAQDVTESRLAEEELGQSNEKLRALSARLQLAREEEGTRIARELHDELGASLTSLKWDLEGLSKRCSDWVNQTDYSVLHDSIEKMIALVDDILGNVRRISSELRPSILDDLGLMAAIEWQARQFESRSGIVCEIDPLFDDAQLNREQSTAIFRILQEALTNILRHAQASRVNVLIEEVNGELVLEIKDNGRGTTEEEIAGSQSLGLIGMRERAHMLGGTIEITGVVGGGTVITLRVPIHP